MRKAKTNQKEQRHAKKRSDPTYEEKLGLAMAEYTKNGNATVEEFGELLADATSLIQTQNRTDARQRLRNLPYGQEILNNEDGRQGKKAQMR